MRIVRVMSIAVCGVLLLLGTVSRAAAGEPKSVSGTVTLNGKAVALLYAYVDEKDAAEPIVVLSDQPLPVGSIPFLPEKLVKEKAVHAIAFSVSRKDKTLTNTYGNTDRDRSWGSASGESRTETSSSRSSGSTPRRSRAAS